MIYNQETGEFSYRKIDCSLKVHHQWILFGTGLTDREAFGLRFRCLWLFGRPLKSWRVR